MLRVAIWTEIKISRFVEACNASVTASDSATYSRTNPLCHPTIFLLVFYTWSTITNHSCHHHCLH